MRGHGSASTPPATRVLSRPRGMCLDGNATRCKQAPTPFEINLNHLNHIYLPAPFQSPNMDDLLANMQSTIQEALDGVRLLWFLDFSYAQQLTPQCRSFRRVRHLRRGRSRSMSSSRFSQGRWRVTPRQYIWTLSSFSRILSSVTVRNNSRTRDRGY